MLSHVFDPAGRLVIFDLETHFHLTRRRSRLLDHVDAILIAVALPDFHELDPLPGRERFYKQHLDSRRWLRVVVSFEADPARVVTAFVQRYDPRS